MATQPERIILTYDDYAQLPNDGNRYELFDGELIFEGRLAMRGNAFR